MKTLGFNFDDPSVQVDLSNNQVLKPMTRKSDGGVGSFGVESVRGLALMPRESQDKRCRMWTSEESKFVIKAYNQGKSIYSMKKIMDISMRAIALHLRQEYGVLGLDRYIK